MSASSEKMTVKFVKEMYILGHFNETDTTNWEKIPGPLKTYDNDKT